MESKSDLEMTELVRLIDQLIDGSMSADEQRRLEQWVLNSSSARRVYVEHMHLQGMLQEASFEVPFSLNEILNRDGLDGRSGQGDTNGDHSNHRFKTATGHHHRWSLWLPLAAAFALMVVGWQFGRWQISGSGEGSVKTVATLLETKGARWEGMVLPTLPGTSISSGRLRLAAGLATIEFQSGAVVKMEGPAELEIVDQQTCHLHHGTLTAHVPPQAVGFVVNTEHARLIDHGTNFGVSVDRFGEAQVRVFDGKVELQHHQSGQRMELLTRQGALVGDEDLARSEKEEDDTGAAKRRDAVVPSGPDVMMVSSAEGRGRAGYAWSPGTDLHFSKELLILKHGERPSYRRKAWLGFDLEKVQTRKIRKATLTLMFESTGWGYASLLPDAVFSVYGIKDDELDDWNAEALTWESAPANDPDGGGADLTKAVKLGSFTLPEGVLDGAFSLSSQELTEFLNQDGNRFATLMVVRETMEERSGGVVHGFAGNAHPLLRPPTLHLSLED